MNNKNKNIKPADRKSSYTRDDLVLCGTGGLFGSETGHLAE